MNACRSLAGADWRCQGHGCQRVPVTIQASLRPACNPSPVMAYCVVDQEKHPLMDATRQETRLAPIN